MTPGARVQATIELLDDIDRSRAPAEQSVARYSRARRYIGAKDRNAIAERVYALLRHRGQVDWWCARSELVNGSGGAPDARARLIAWLILGEGWDDTAFVDAFDGGRYRPAELDTRERAALERLAGRHLDDAEQPDWVRGNHPAWLRPHLERALGPHLAAELAGLDEPAPVDLRVNTLKADRAAAQAALAEAGIDAAPTPLSPVGVRVSGRPRLRGTTAYREGLLDLQDEASQIAALLVDAQPGMRVCDFCAGAGGKTLALAATMRDHGRIVACDVEPWRLMEASRRLRRAGVQCAERRPLSGIDDPWLAEAAGRFDRVLIDAPCTGTGSWRREPDARWRLQPDDLDVAVARQQALLGAAAPLVRPGGRLTYVTCSLLAEENAAQVETFLAAHPEWRAMPVGALWSAAIGAPLPASAAAADRWLTLSPATTGTDGFFVAVLQRPAAGPGAGR